MVVEAGLDQRRPRRPRAPGCRRLSGRQDQGPRPEVLEVEAELVLLVGRVQRRRCADPGGREEEDDGLRAVREHERDSVPASEAELRERIRRPVDLFPQVRVGQSRPIRHVDRDSTGFCVSEDSIERLFRHDG